MLNDILLSFFFAMPAVVALIHSRQMAAPVARALLFWGGALCTLFAAMVVVPMLACSGTIMSSYSSCIGGEGLAALFNAAQPMILLGAKLYILAGVPLAMVAFAVEWLSPKPAA